MTVSFYAPVVFVEDIERSKKFYTEILGEEKKHDFGDNVVFKSRLSLWKIRPDHEIASIAGRSKQGNTFEIYYETDDIQVVAEKIKENDIRLLHDIKTEPWGQMTFRFFDPDDHLIEVGESFDRFITRIYRETGSVDTTARRTGVRADTVRKIIQKNL